MPSSIVRALRSDRPTLKPKIARMMVMLQLFTLCVGGAMASTSEEEKILEAAVAGIPRVAEAVASIPRRKGQGPWTRWKAVTDRLCWI